MLVALSLAQMASAICLIRHRARNFIIVTAALGVAAEVLGSWISGLRYQQSNGYGRIHARIYSSLAVEEGASGIAFAFFRLADLRNTLFQEPAREKTPQRN